MAYDTSRREFLVTSLSVLPLVRTELAQTPPRRIAFFGESGQFDQRRWIVGALIVDGAVDHARKLRELRLSTKYYKSLRRRQTDTYRKEFGEGIIEYFFRSPDIQFVGRVVTDTRPTEYRDVYRSVAAVVVAKDPARLQLRQHRGPIDIDDLVADLKANVKAATIVESSTDESRLWTVDKPLPPGGFKIALSDLPELAAFLAGLIAGRNDQQFGFFQRERRRRQEPAKS